MAGIIYLLDTNTCVALMNKHQKAQAYLVSIPARQVHLCSIVEGELYFGVYKSQRSVKNLASLEVFLKNFSFLPITTEVSKQYGQIRAELTKQGQIIGPNDLWIAATAIAHRAVLVTHNTKEFQRVKGLHLEDWL